MWTRDDKKEEKKEIRKREVVKPLLKPETPVEPRRVLSEADLMSSEDSFKFSFLNSEEIRKAHGFSMKSGKLVLLNKTWIESTADKEKVEWIRKIFKEKNGVKQ